MIVIEKMKIGARLLRVYENKRPYIYIGHWAKTLYTKENQNKWQKPFYFSAHNTCNILEQHGWFCSSVFKKKKDATLLD